MVWILACVSIRHGLCVVLDCRRFSRRQLTNTMNDGASAVLLFREACHVTQPVGGRVTAGERINGRTSVVVLATGHGGEGEHEREYKDEGERDACKNGTREVRKLWHLGFTERAGIAVLP